MLGYRQEELGGDILKNAPNSAVAKWLPKFVGQYAEVPQEVKDAAHALLWRTEEKFIAKLERNTKKPFRDLMVEFEKTGEKENREKLKKVFGAIRSGVNEGSSLANAMGQHPEVFDTLYISMIRAGEASGALDAVLIRLADFTEAQARLKSKVQSAMMYPLIMTGVGGIIMTILFVVVIPRITKIFTQVKADLPIQTKFLIFVADAIKGYWWLILIMMGIAVWLFRKWKATKKGRRIYDVWALKLPQIGAIVRLVAVARFSRTLATLLRAGVPVLTALDIVRDVLNNVRLAEVVADARDAIREGESIAEPLRRSKEFPPIVVHMIATGEKSGQLEHMLESVADNYDFQVDERVGRLTTLIEPIMIVGMGGAVAFVVWAILMPILSLSQHVNK